MSVPCCAAGGGSALLGPKGWLCTCLCGSCPQGLPPPWYCLSLQMAVDSCLGHGWPGHGVMHGLLMLRQGMSTGRSDGWEREAGSGCTSMAPDLNWEGGDLVKDTWLQ